MIRATVFLVIFSYLLFTFQLASAVPVYHRRQVKESASNVTAEQKAEPLFEGEEVRIATSEEEATQKYYMILSEVAYCASVIENSAWDCTVCGLDKDINIIKTFDTDKYDTNALVLRDDKLKRIIAVFRGSSSTENTIADLDFILVDYPHASGAKAHSGFQNSYNEIASEIVPVIGDQVKQYPNYTLAVTGHSLGSATGLLCALDLVQQGYHPSLFAQGTPRVGNRKFADYVNGAGFPYTRLTNKKDLIVDLPPRLFGYIHAGIEYWIKEDNEIQVCESNIETPDCANSELLGKNMADHSNYFDLSTDGQCPA